MPTMEERMTRVEHDVAHIKATLEHVATKADLADFKTEVKAETAEIKTDIAEFKAESRAESAELKASMADLKSEMMTELTWRMFGMAVGMVVAISAATGIAIAVAEMVLD